LRSYNILLSKSLTIYLNGFHYLIGTLGKEIQYMQADFFGYKKYNLILLSELPIFGSRFARVLKYLIFFFLNKRNKTGSFVFFVLFCITSGINAQYDPNYSQYMFNPLAINPGFSGISGRINVVALDRHQWMGLEGAPNTTVMGADMALNIFGNPGGVGLVISNDRIGFFRDLNIQGSVSQKYELGEGLLGVGLSFGMINQVVDGTKFISNPDIGGGSYYHQEADNLVPKTEVNGTTIDAGVGFYYKDEKYFSGFSVMHLFEPKPNFNEEFSVYIPRSFFLTFGYNYAMWEYPMVLKPSVLIKAVGPIWQYDFNMSVVYLDKMWGGISYRYQDAIVVMGGMELSSGLKVGYSYDITTSRLAKVSNGSHEIMVGYTFDLSLEKRAKRYKSVRFL